MIYMVLIYLLSKIIIEKNAQSISMVKILGYTNGEISRLYILSTSVVVVLCLLLSLPIETAVMNVLFREMMLASISGWITLWIDPMIYVQMFGAGIVTYGLVALLEFRRVKKVPMDEALKMLSNERMIFSITRQRREAESDKNLTLSGFCVTVSRKLLDQSVGIGDYYEKKINFKSNSNYQRSYNQSNRGSERNSRENNCQSSGSD